MKSEVVLVAPGTLAPGAVIPLDAEERHHLTVRRARLDQAIVAMDGMGRTASARLRTGGREWSLEVASVEEAARRPTTTLAVGAGDRDRLLWLAEKSTELGVARLIPFTSERTAGVASRLRDQGVERLRRRAREACKQSGNPWATEISPIRSLDQLIADRDALGPHCFLADPAGRPMPASRRGEPSAWIIGPEGGLTAEEVERFREGLGAATIALAPWILRMETAAIAAAVMAELGRQEGPGGERR